MEASRELYWGGFDREGVPTLTWLIGKHNPSNHCPKRFVRFFIREIERGLRTSSLYPNSMFNIFVELTDAGIHSIDGGVSAILQPILVKNYPKVRKSMYVFPVNWFVQLCWNTVLKPLISSLQPDIEDKLCPLYGDYRPQLFARYAEDQVEVAFGGTLDLLERPPLKVLSYDKVFLDAVLESERDSQGRKTQLRLQVSGDSDVLHAAESLTLLESQAPTTRRPEAPRGGAAAVLAGRVEPWVDPDVNSSAAPSTMSSLAFLIFVVSFGRGSLGTAVGLCMATFLCVKCHRRDRDPVIGGGSSDSPSLSTDPASEATCEYRPLAVRDPDAVCGREAAWMACSTQQRSQRSGWSSILLDTATTYLGKYCQQIGL